MKEMQETRWAPRWDERVRNDRPDSYRYPLNEENLNMLKIMSHDLRGSLVSTLATLKLLTRGYYGRMDHEVENKLQELQDRVTRSIRMAEECLEKALSAEGNAATGQEVLDLRKDVIHPVIEELSSEIKDHQLRIDNRLEHVPARRIPIKANRVWLKMIFRNLLKNAIQYGDSGGTIAFGFEIRGSSYRLNVYNSGKPIPERWRDKLFTKVVPMGIDRNPMTKGMGIGLYLIKRIIQKLGGNIWYEAKEHGSNFVLTLPIEAH
jgi:signal transduction histidine kinase